MESGSLADLRHLTRTSVTADLTAAPDVLTGPSGLGGVTGVHELVAERRDGLTRVMCEVDSDQLGVVLRQLADHGVRSLVSSPPTLEELFLRHYADDGGAGSGAGAGAGAGGCEPAGVTTR